MKLIYILEKKTQRTLIYNQKKNVDIRKHLRVVANI